jgi:hypothetical protein
MSYDGCPRPIIKSGAKVSLPSGTSSSAGSPNGLSSDDAAGHHDGRFYRGSGSSIQGATERHLHGQGGAGHPGRGYDGPWRDGQGVWRVVEPGQGVGVWKEMPPPTKFVPRTDCGFCLNNGEDAKMYRSHITKNEAGVVECPILRRYQCPICQATGDRAHTIKYCPKNKDGRYNNGASVSDLKKLRNATGKLSAYRSRTLSTPNFQSRPFVGGGPVGPVLQQSPETMRTLSLR